MLIPWSSNGHWMIIGRSWNEHRMSVAFPSDDPWLIIGWYLDYNRMIIASSSHDHWIDHGIVIERSSNDHWTRGANVQSRREGGGGELKWIQLTQLCQNWQKNPTQKWSKSGFKVFLIWNMWFWIFLDRVFFVNFGGNFQKILVQNWQKKTRSQKWPKMDGWIPNLT